MDTSSWLHYYSKVFDYVEIDSSFYRIPSAFMVRKWERTTPVNFRFTAKFPKVITHDTRLQNVDIELDISYGEYVRMIAYNIHRLSVFMVWFLQSP